MKNFKKKICLYLALIMVFGLVTPFAVPRMEVRAQIVSAGQTLSVWPTHNPLNDARLGGGLDGAPVSLVVGEATSRNDTLLHWRVSPDPAEAGADGLYVLRFFSTLGNKFEVLVERGTDVDGAFINVTYYAFPRLEDTPENAADIAAGIIYGPPLTPTPGALTTEPIRQFGFGNGAFNDPLHGHVLLRFLWGAPIALGGNPDDFYFFIEGGLSLGFVYDFTLEFYTRPQANLFLDGGDVHEMRLREWRPNELREPGWPRYVPAESDRVFVFPGFGANDIEAFPFARSYSETAPDNNAPHTLPPGLSIPGQFPWNRGLTDPPPPGAPENTPPTPIAPFPQYQQHPLEVSPSDDTIPPDHPTIERPAEPINGLDIRVQLPRFFEERTGRFSQNFENGVTRYGLPELGSEIVVGPLGSRYAFQVNTIMSELEAYTPGGTGTAGASLPTDNLHPDHPGIFLQNASTLTRRVDGELVTVARFAVAGLPPSIVYDSIRVTLAPEVGDVFNSRATILNFNPLGGPRLHTFLEYIFTPPIAGMSNVLITPYRRHTGEPVHGTYGFQRTGIGVTEPPISVNFNGETTHVTIPVILGTPQQYYIAFSMGGPEAMRSQTSIYRPDRRPTVGAPNVFRIVRNSLFDRHPVEFTPRRDVPRVPPLPPNQLGDVNFWVEWQLGTVADLIDMVDEREDQNNPGSGITLLYRLNRGVTPDFPPVSPPEDFQGLAPYADVWMTLAVDRTVSPAVLRVIDSRLDFSPYGESYVFNHDPDDPVIRVHSLGGIAFASANIRSEAVHIELGDLSPDSSPVYPPLSSWNDPFRFPGAPYYMNIEVIGMYTHIGANKDQPVLNFREWPMSPQDYLVLDDFGRVTPPPPSDMRVSADHRLETPPSLDVSFSVHAQAFNTWMNQQYEFAPLIFVNIYVSTFESAILDLASADPLELPADAERGSHLRWGFEENRIAVTDTTPVPGRPTLPPMGEIDMSAEQVQEALRGASGGVVRIADIPIPLSLLNADHETRLQLTQDWLDAGPVPSIEDFSVRLNNLDENRRYFVFADLVVVRHHTTRSALIAGVAPGDEIEDEPINRSVSTPMVNDTTIGTPSVPDPGEVDPSAPTGLDHLPPTETEVTLYWDRIVSPDQNVRIEYEILRVTDNPMSRNELDELGRPLGTIVTSRADAKGWFTEMHPHPLADDYEPRLWVYTNSTIPVRHPVDGEGVAYTYSYPAEPQPPLTDSQVSLTDRSLRPNSLYYYYVRTVRRVFDAEGNLTSESRSAWVEDSVTTSVVQPPINLREEDGSVRYGFDPQSMVFVSWEHRDMEAIIRDAGENFAFQVQLRADGEEWGQITNVSRSQLLNPNNFAGGRFFYMVFGLRHSTVYEMRVRLYDINTEDASLWSNIITFMTQHVDDGEDEVEDWLRELERRLRELLRRPFWFAQNTPTSTIMVYRPDEVFAGQILATPGAAISLYNTDVGNITYYLPASVIRDANDDRRGFSTRYSDLEILFPPGFLNSDHNQVVMDMLRALDARGSNLSDYFVRVDLERVNAGEIHGVPSISRQTYIQLTLAGTNTSIRNLRSWDANVLDRAERVIMNRVSDAVLAQNIRNLLNANTSNEDMVAHLDGIVASVSNEITRMVGGYMHNRPGGILAGQEMRVTEFDAPLNLVVTNLEADTSVNAFELQVGQWVPRQLMQFHNGSAITASAPGTFAFTGRAVTIPGIVETPHGGAVTSIVARFGLEDVLGLNADLHQNANRHMVVGSVARMAGAPAGADPMTWAAANLNVVMSSRNAQALISRQEAVAIVMALYERGTNTRVDSIQIRNFQLTAGMNLDSRYAQAVRAAFEVGILTDNNFNPAGPLTIGEFLDMLVLLGNRIVL